MSKNKTIKTILLLVLFLIICCIMTKSYALNVVANTSYESIVNALNGNNGTGTVGISYQSAAKNPYIFCRDRGYPLPQNGNYYSYIKDGDVEKHTNDAWAYLFAFGTGFGDSSSTYLRDNHMQQVYWEALSTTDWMNSSNKEIQKAAVYETMANELAQYNAENKPKVTIGTNDKGSNIIGPVRIAKEGGASYPFAVYDNSLIGGIEEFYVYYVDSNGNKIHPRYKLYYIKNGEKEYITGKNIYGNGNFLGKWNVASDIINLNNANKTGGFYIELQDNSALGKEINVKVAYAYLTTEVTFYKIKGKNTLQTSFYWQCEQHKNLPSIVYNGQQYIATGHYKGPSTDTYPQQYTSSDGKLYKWTYTQYYKCSNGHMNTNITTDSFSGRPICIQCKRDDGVDNYNIQSVHIGYANEYELFSCNDCRMISSGTRLQNLVIIKPSKTEGLGWVENDTQITYTPIKFKLNKYGPYFDGTSETLLEGAEFQVKAVQDGVEVYSATITNNNTIVTIQPHSTSRIYVTITETKVPYGFVGIKEPINIVYAYNSNLMVWEYQYRPSQSNWIANLPFGGWTFIKENGKDDETVWALPNEFESKSGDRIRVEQLYSGDESNDYQGHLIKVYNNPGIKELEINLEKYNLAGTTNLIGAEFKITVMQDGEVINTVGEIGETVKMGDKRLTYTIMPKNTDSKIYVKIEETKSPTGYKKIQEIINIIYTFNTETKEWAANYAPTVQEWANSGFKQGDFSENAYKNAKENAYDIYINDVANNSEELKILQGWDPNGTTSLNEYLQDKIVQARRDQLVRGWNNEFPSTYGNWLKSIFTDFGTWSSSDNINYNSTSGDKFSVDANDILIKIYDEPIKTIKLLKVDAETNITLKGAKFTGKISNVKSFVWKGQSFSSLDGEIIIDKELSLNTDEYGQIVFEDVVLRRENEPVVITINEISAPDSGTDEYHYKILSEPVVITMEMTESGGFELVEENGIQYGGEEDVTVEMIDQTAQIKIPNIKVNTIDLELLKIDAKDSSPLRGATFSGTISNVEETTDSESLTLYETDDGTEGLEFENITTNEQGKIVFSNLKVKDLDNSIIVTITEISVPDGDNFYYKKLSREISIDIEWTNEGTFELVEIIKGEEDNVTVNIENPKVQITIPNERLIDISGKVWLDGQTGLKPTIPANGEMESTEQGVAGVIVELIDDNENIVKQFYYNDNNELLQPDAKDITDEDGTYNFKGIDWGKEYTVRFTYDGINYEDTLYNVNVEPNERNSDAQEDATTRNTFNDKFHTITKDWAYSVEDENDNKIETKLEYNEQYDEDTKSITSSTLKTLYEEGNEEGKDVGTAKQEFRMSAKTVSTTFNATTDNIDFGLVKRGTDLALITNVSKSEVCINGETTEYGNTGTIRINNNDGSINDTVPEDYYVKIKESDYNYRIRDFANILNLTEKNYMNGNDTTSLKSGDELEVYVTYSLTLINSSENKNNATINTLKYYYDEGYELSEIYYYVQENGELKEVSYSKDYYSNENNIIEISNYNNVLQIGKESSNVLFLRFKVIKNSDDNIPLKTYYNAAEITSYSTPDGFIDTDSQPGNLNYKKEKDNDTNTVTITGNFEDDSDKASSNIALDTVDEVNTERTITGYVWDNDNTNKKVDDVIVQLIELRTHNNKVYEYIWQETVSGSGTGKRISSTGTDLDTYTYSKTTGQYKFKGFIPGNYIVRFIYGDGFTYNLTDNVITYNGQDYKSMADSNYSAEWYNTSSYTEGASVARDNEARRLETMAYSVNVDAKKGLLLKLLDNVKAEDLNQTEKETLISTYNEFYEPDITEVTDEIITKLLKEKVLSNTWMCAETSKIKVTVDNASNNVSNVQTTENVTGQASYTNINLGLAKRPETKIELKKYITGFKLTASNGQVLVNARVDVDKYLDGTETISNEVQGIKNNVVILGTQWQYEVSPTELNTIVEGAKLEYEYTLVVRNTGENDNLSNTLINKYENSTIGDYATQLGTWASTMKTDMRLATREISTGYYLGTAYYTISNGYNTGNVQTEVTKIRDYINNDLTKTPSGDVTIDEEASGQEYRVLRDDYSTQKVKINTVLKTTRTTGKMQPGSNDVMYTVTLGRDPISSTGTISFENYIAEVMSYTNAAGRRTTTSTPGNAEIIDAELRDGRTHEIDEADTGRIQIGVKTGEDEETNYILITAIAAGIIVIAVGAFVIKKYIIK